MSAGTLISIEEYLNTSFRPDCDYVDGRILERNVGKRRHGYAQGRISAWFIQLGETLGLDALTALRIQVAPTRVRIADVVVVETPLPDEEVFTSPPFLCAEVMSPGDTAGSMQDLIGDYLNFGVPNIWVIDPWKHRGWRVTREGWIPALDGIMRTADHRIAMPLSEVLLP